MKRLVAILTVSFLAGVAVAQEGEPEITPEEIIVPPAEWDDGWNGNPPPWFEAEATVNCQSAPSWCEEIQEESV